MSQEQPRCWDLAEIVSTLRTQSYSTPFTRVLFESQLIDVFIKDVDYIWSNLRDDALVRIVLHTPDGRNWEVHINQYNLYVVGCRDSHCTQELQHLFTAVADRCTYFEYINMPINVPTPERQETYETDWDLT